MSLTKLSFSSQDASLATVNERVNMIVLKQNLFQFWIERIFWFSQSVMTPTRGAKTMFFPKKFSFEDNELPTGI